MKFLTELSLKSHSEYLPGLCLRGNPLDVAGEDFWKCEIPRNEKFFYLFQGISFIVQNGCGNIDCLQFLVVILRHLQSQISKCF